MQLERNVIENVAAGPPLTPRSVVASLLLGTHPPLLAGRRLVRAAERFGFTENATRVALSRMVGSGELVLAEGTYGLAGALLDRQQRHEPGRRPALRAWDGTWLVAVVGADGTRRPPAQRSSVRRQLGAARVAGWRGGGWGRPGHPAGGRPAGASSTGG